MYDLIIGSRSIQENNILDVPNLPIIGGREIFEDPPPSTSTTTLSNFFSTMTDMLIAPQELDNLESAMREKRTAMYDAKKQEAKELAKAPKGQSASPATKAKRENAETEYNAALKKFVEKLEPFYQGLVKDAKSKGKDQEYINKLLGWFERKAGRPLQLEEEESPIVKKTK
jgi:hypothetical protein